MTSRVDYQNRRQDRTRRPVRIAAGSPSASKEMYMTLLQDLWGFMRERKKYWLLPLTIVLLSFGTLFVLVSGTAVAPFIYTLF